MEKKKLLYDLCLEALEKRIDIAKTAMDDAQQSANTEEKNTAGDKYETGRAMSQNARELSAKQLNAALNEKEILEKIDPENITEFVALGSMVKTTAGNFFIAVGAGKLVLEDETWYALSHDAPVAQAILNKKPKEKYTFRDKTETVLEVA
jgi:hypothetical protein